MKTIKQVFPFYILLMVCYEQTLSLLINYNIYDSRQLVIYTCWIPVILLPYYLFKKKFFYKIAVVLLFVEGFINVCHLLIVKGPVNASSLFILSNTNSNEAKDFINLKFSLYLVLIFPYLFLFIMALKNRFSIVSYPKSKWIVSVIFLFSLIFIADNLINKRLIRKGIPHTTKAIISFVEEQKSYNALQKRVVANVPTKFMSEKWKPQIFVLIIGESCNRNHMSLYNYHTETNPRLGKRNDIIVYKNVVSPYSNTLNSVLTILTEANLENKMSIDKSISLIDVFHSADYKTFWLSNQSPIGVWDNAIYNIAHTADVATFVNNNGNSSYESTYLSSYDEKLFSPFYTALNEKTKNKFIVIHLMGSHSTYSKRYPIAYNKFVNTTNSNSQTINEYNNSILYNDFVVDSLLSILDSFSNNNNSIASAIYLADHSENVYDENNSVGHDFTGSLPKSNVEIPFIIWLSAGYKNSFINKQKTIVLNSNKPFVSDDLFHSVIDLNNIYTNAYSNTRSNFNANFNDKRIRILEDNRNYDLK